MLARIAATSLILLQVACGRLGFDALAAAADADAGAVEVMVTPSLETCIVYQDPSGDTCPGAPLVRDDDIFIVYEFKMPSIPADATATAAVLGALVDPSDDDNVDATLGTIQFVPNFGENLIDAPGQTSEAVFGAEVNAQPAASAPAAGLPISFAIDGRYLRSDETVWIGIVGQDLPDIILTRGSAALSFTLTDALPADELVDDSRLGSDVRVVYPTFTGCRNLDAEDTTKNECRFGALKLDTSPDLVRSYLHFTIPNPPQGRTLASAQLAVHTTRGYDSQGGGAGELSTVEPFTPTSLDQPGAANTPTIIAAAAVPPSTSIDQYEQQMHDLFAGVADPGELYLELAPSGGNAVWLYSHEPPRAEQDRRPHLILTYQ